MKMPAQIRYGDILSALEISEIPGFEMGDEAIIELEDVEVDESDFECPICDGEPDDPADAVNPMLIADFLKAVRDGDIHTAQALVGRVFETPEDVAIVDRGLCRCANQVPA